MCFQSARSKWRTRAGGQTGNAGFTLVELLVVISIIAILVAMLLPALNKARASAVTLQCASNMRQVGQAIQMFANDNGGRCPGELCKWSGTSMIQATPGGWQDILNQLYFQKATTDKPAQVIPQYQSQNSACALNCPSVQIDYSAASRVFAINVYALGGASVNLSPPDPTKYGIYASPTIFNSAYVQYDPANPVSGTYEYWLGTKLAAFTNSAEKALVGEVERSTDIFGQAISTPPKLGDSASYPSWAAGGGLYSFRHNNYKNENMLFVDMHVETITCNPGIKTIDARFSPYNVQVFQVTP